MHVNLERLDRKNGLYLENERSTSKLVLGAYLKELIWYLSKSGKVWYGQFWFKMSLICS